jgi:hypothetical protein
MTMGANIGFLAVLEVDLDNGPGETWVRLRCPSCDEEGGWVLLTAPNEFPFDYYVDHNDDCPRFIEEPEVAP